MDGEAHTLTEGPTAALGERVRTFGGNLGESPWREIVGVVGSVHDDGMSQDAVPTIFWPQVQEDFWGNELHTQRSMAYAVRARGGNPDPMDPATFAAVALGLSAIALVASYIPARRAAGVDPVEALRAEL